MAGGYWGSSRTSQETLDIWYDKLLEKCDYLEEEEIKYFYHCTTLKGKESIQKEGKLIGGYTELPARAPLASNEDVRGIWIAMSPRELLTRSPYGTQRFLLKVKPLMTQLSTPLEKNIDVFDEDQYHADEVDEEPRKGQTKGKRNKKKPKKPVKKNQKDCYVKDRSPEKPIFHTPMLFFECAHHYGSVQYVRLVLIRQDDELVDWCIGTLKEIDIRNNPFLCFKWGKIFSYTVSEKKHDIIVETLVIGDIYLNQLLESPEWDIVGTVSRAGFDPSLGVA